MARERTDTITFDFTAGYSDGTSVLMSVETPMVDDCHMHLKPENVLECKSYDELKTEVSARLSSNRDKFSKAWGKIQKELKEFDDIISITMVRTLETEDMFLSWARHVYPDLKPLAKKAAGKTAKAEAEIPKFIKYADDVRCWYPASDITPQWPTGFCASEEEGRICWRHLTDDGKEFARMVNNRTIPGVDSFEEKTEIDFVTRQVKQTAIIYPGGLEKHDGKNQATDPKFKGLPSIYGLIFAVTGDMKKYKHRGELTEVIERAGGNVTASVSKKTDYLINNSKRSGSTKNQRAKELGIKIISELEFIDMFTEADVKKPTQKKTVKGEKPAFEYIIKDGVLEITSIGKTLRARSFKENGDIRKVIIPEGVERIGMGAFYGCENLQEIELPKTLKFIGEYAFYLCENLEEINIPENVKTIETHAFSTKRHYMLEQEDVVLKKVVISDEMVKKLGIRGLIKAFNINDLIISMLHYPDNYTGELRKKLLNEIKKEEKSILNAILSSDNDEMLNNFYGLQKRVSLEMVEEAISSVENSSCNIPKVKAFLLEYKNTHFSQEQVEKAYQESVEKELGIRGKTLADWRKIFRISIKDGKASITGYKEKSNKEDLVIPERIGRNTVTEIGDKAFENTSFRHVQIPETLEKIGERAFYRSSIEELVIPEGVKVIEREAFAKCTYLKEVRSNGVDTIGHAVFERCYRLEKVILEPGTTSLGVAVCRHCNNLLEIKIGEGPKVIEQYAFLDCWNLKEVVVPESVVAIREGAFSFCNSLKSFSMLNEKAYIQGNPFQTLDGYEWMYDGNGFYLFMGNLFKYTGEDEIVTVPDGVHTIKSSGFFRLNVRKIIIPVSVKHIDTHAFAYCPELEEIIVKGTHTEVMQGAIEECAKAVIRRT